MIKSVLSILVTVALGAGLAIACSYKGVTVVDGLPLFALCVIVAFVINWIAFIPAYFKQTEKFFDLTGSLTYIIVTLIAVVFSPVRDLRTYIVMALVFIWAARLGTFLFRRIMKDGKDGRFDDLKPDFLRFLLVWTLQGLWVTFTLAAALVVITTTEKMPLGIWAIVGIVVWILGFSIEAISDAQKSKWRENPANKGKFINVGLWSKSRHPNYFGEITLWIGIAIIALPVLQGWQYFALISPVFVTILLTKISGVPMLEKRADEKWGGRADYEAYKKSTPVLIPKFWG